jgi:hypothetical protein
MGLRGCWGNLLTNIDTKRRKLDIRWRKLTKYGVNYYRYNLLIMKWFSFSMGFNYHIHWR